jgi:hypothetical protein
MVHDHFVPGTYLLIVDDLRVLFITVEISSMIKLIDQSWMGGWTDEHTNRGTERRTDRQIDRQAVGQIGR